MLEAIMEVSTPALLSTTRGLTEDWSFSMTTIRQCARCKQTQDASLFSFRNKKKQLRTSYCKACEKLYRDQFLATNYERELIRKRQYHSDNREKLLAGKREKYNADKKTYLARSKKYRDENKELVAQKQKQYFQENPEVLRHAARLRKVRKKTNGIFLVTLKDEQRLRSKPCFYCGSYDSIQLDHVVPLVRGGTHSIGNLLPACRRCNTQKNKWFITEWKILKQGWATNVRES